MPGSQPDVSAHKLNPLSSKIELLPLGYFVAGDNAYGCTEHLLTPFSGEGGLVASQNNYNYYFSQLRTTIERAFAYLTGRFRIFQIDQKANLRKIGLVYLSCYLSC